MTSTGTSIVALIRNRLDELRPSEQAVARIVIEKPEQVMRLSISALAKAAGVSEPTVIRFCRTMSLGGFTDLKLALATDLANGTPFVDAEVLMTDTPAVIGGKMFGSAMTQLTLVRDRLDYDSILEAAKAIEKARRIDICGIAQSNFVAAELQHRLVRMGFSAIAMPDAHMQLQAAASLSSGDVALIMSFAGQIKETVAVARLARRVGATVVIVSRSGSALAAEADILINVDSDEKTFIYASSATRLAHLLAVDILTTILAIRAGQSMIDRLRLSRMATKDYWLPETD